VAGSQARQATTLRGCSCRGTLRGNSALAAEPSSRLPMRFTSDHDLFRQTVREFLTREVNPRVEEWEQAHQFPAHEVLPSLAQLGLLGLEYDAADGGQGADHWYTVIFGEELGRWPSPSTPIWPHPRWRASARPN
jgi:alkylation response protein AidB-like acyl-CoA dehydrogenase